jgi:prepilin-type N-terminal cleavage/methylation domain-containing protein
MPRSFTIKQLKRLRFLVKPKGAKGFTLLELLVSMLIAALITVLLLGLVVELTQTNQQDAARTRVQQDMQAAMDYIAQDLREAVFVYNGACLNGITEPTTNANPPLPCSGVINANYLPDEVKKVVPVLAFWRTDPLPNKIRDLCADNVNGLSDKDNRMNQARVSCVSGNTYSLVLYGVDTSNPNNVWQGKARLVRYKLSQFPDQPDDENDQSVGYVNPVEDSKGASLAFQRWPLDKNNRNRQDDGEEAKKTGQPNTSQNPLQVLVDFVDDKGAIVVDEQGNYVGRSTPKCNGFANDVQGANALSPIASNNPNNPSNIYSFYACVTGGGVGDNTRTGENQEVQLTLIGNVTGQGGFFKSDAGDKNKDRLSPLQTRVLVRGVTNKPES